jgi:Cd2+/Zn2+-exporting ATPase
MNSASALKTLQAQIGGMDCGGCAKTIEATLQQLPESLKLKSVSPQNEVTYDASK